MVGRYWKRMEIGKKIDMKKGVNRILNPVSEEEMVITASDAHWLINDHVQSIQSRIKKIEKHLKDNERYQKSFKAEISIKHTSEVRKSEMLEQFLNKQDYRRYELNLLLAKAQYENLRNMVLLKKFIAYTRLKEERINYNVMLQIKL